MSDKVTDDDIDFRIVGKFCRDVQTTINEIKLLVKYRMLLLPYRFSRVQE